MFKDAAFSPEAAVNERGRLRGLPCREGRTKPQDNVEGRGENKENAALCCWLCGRSPSLRVRRAERVPRLFTIVKCRRRDARFGPGAHADPVASADCGMRIENVKKTLAFSVTDGER